MNAHTTPGSQRGAALAVGLIMLLILTLIGISSMQASLLQERMTGNTRDLGYAFQSAEAALREGERWLNSMVIKPAEVTACGTGCDVDDVVWLDSAVNNNQLKNVGDWWNGSAATGMIRASPTAPKNVATAPDYIIEFRAFARDSYTMGTGPITGRSVYDITARGTGSTNTSQAILRSRYAQRY